MARRISTDAHRPAIRHLGSLSSLETALCSLTYEEPAKAKAVPRMLGHRQSEQKQQRKSVRDGGDAEVELEPGTAGIRLRGPFIWTVRLVRPDLANGIS